MFKKMGGILSKTVKILTRVFIWMANGDFLLTMCGCYNGRKANCECKYEKHLGKRCSCYHKKKHIPQPKKLDHIIIDGVDKPVVYTIHNDSCDSCSDTSTDPRIANANDHDNLYEWVIFGSSNSLSGIEIVNK
jgi:hypothetical protein